MLQDPTLNCVQLQQSGGVVYTLVHHLQRIPCTPYPTWMHAFKLVHHASADHPSMDHTRICLKCQYVLAWDRIPQLLGSKQAIM